MIDPDNIQILESNLPSRININSIPPFETVIYDFNDDKDYKNFIKDTKNNIRRSFEYRQMIKYLRENMGMDKCAFIQNVSNNDTFDIKIEIHHYPFTLEDIVDIVFKKRTYYGESLEVQMLAKEVMMLHYKLLVGLISLSETVHELVHSSRLFIPIDAVLGRPLIFVEYYKPFCTSDQLEVLDRIVKYSEEKTSYLYNTTLLEENRVEYNIKDEQFKLPEFNRISENMIERMETIKQNNYLLPTVNDVPMDSTKTLEEDLKQNPNSPFYFDYSLMKNVS